MAQIVVVGATGYAGRFIVAEAAARGHDVTAVVRSRDRAAAPGTVGAPSLEGHVTRWRVGSVTDPGFARDVAGGADHVISALGVTGSKASPWDVDHAANLNVLRGAEAAGVSSFTYLHVVGAADNPSALTQAKEAFARELRASSVTHHIVSPSGYFSDLRAYFDMAKSGRVFRLGAGKPRLNPIHGADLAAFTVDQALSPSDSERAVGGPDVFTQTQIAELACDALGHTPRFVSVPPRVAQFATRVVRAVAPRQGELMAFFVYGMAHDMVGEQVGRHHLGDFFMHLAEKGE